MSGGCLTPVGSERSRPTGNLETARLDTPLFAIENLQVSFDGRTALHGVDLSIRRGEALGMVGESGCGKSVTWLASLGLLPPKARATGAVRLEGEDILNAPARKLEQVRGRRVAMIFQDPSSSLNPVLRVGRQIGEALSLHRGLFGASRRAEAKRLLDLVNMPDSAGRLNAYPHELSGGQNQRVMIAMALAGNPDLLVADEPTTALDATVQAQILALLDRLRRETGMALVLISHDLGAVADICERVCVMYAGRVIEEAPVDAVFDDPRHPYTHGLIAALPEIDGPRQRLAPIPGIVPEPWRLPPGCAFAPRCGFAGADCGDGAPPLAVAAAGRRLACRHPEWREAATQRNAA